MLKIIAIIEIVFFLGCAHTKSYSDFVSEASSFRQNDILTITLIDEEKFSGNQLMFTKDSLCWNNAKTNERQSVLLSNVRKIEIKKHGRGALDGLKIGALSGGFIGILVGGSLQNSNPEDEGTGEYFDSGKAAIVVGAIGAACGGIIGSIIGSIKGSQVVYYFDKDSSIVK